MLVVLDTNIWREELGLNSSLGAAVRFFLKKRKAKLVVPEVVKLETQKLLRDECTRWVNKIQSEHRQLLAVFGSLREVVLPDAGEIEARVDAVFKDVGVDVVEVPFTLESARDSFLKSVQGVPPSGKKDQQFKDGVLWADCRRLLQEDDVILVTRDSGFYQDRNLESGLVENLKQEIGGSPHKLTLVSSLNFLLDEIREEVQISDSALVASIHHLESPSISRILSSNEFRLGDSIRVNSNLFATEIPETQHLTFEIFQSCVDVTDKGRTNGELRLAGDGNYAAVSAAFFDLRLSRLELTFVNADGTLGRGAAIHALVGTATLGHRKIAHQVRYPLAEQKSRLGRGREQQ